MIAGSSKFSQHLDLTLYSHFQLPQLPSTSELGFVTTHYYNRGVKSTIHFIEMLPCYTGQMIKKASDAVKKATEAPPVQQD